MKLTWFSVTGALALVLIAVMIPVMFWLLNREQKQQSATLRTLVCHFEVATINSPTLTVAQKVNALKIYNDALRAINEPAC